MAFREKGGALVVPSVVHWKVGHYAAVVRQEGDRYLVQDPTFRNDVWATRQALEAESSGYFLIPPGSLPHGWRAVEANEGAAVWGKGLTSDNDPGPITKRDAKTTPNSCRGMAVSGVHLMAVNLNIIDEPVGYSPPVGPAVRFTVRYNQRDAFQPANFAYGNFSSKWTCDWMSYLTDSPSNLLADVKYYVGGGGQRTFTGFNPATQTFGYQQYDETLLTRTGTNSYELLSRDGSKLIFSQSDGSVGTSRNIFLTQVIDPSGNAVTLTYDELLRLVAITDAIGQVTTLAYGVPGIAVGGVFVPEDSYKITKVTDPFGRFATFDYGVVLVGIIVSVVSGSIIETIETPLYGWQLVTITDEIGLTSQFTYNVLLRVFSVIGSTTYYVASDVMTSLITAYGTNTFTGGGGRGERHDAPPGNRVSGR